MKTGQVHIIGGGLAGSEAAWQLAERGFQVRLSEMRPDHPTAVHKTGELAELVCSNSLKSTAPDSAAGLLKEELCRMGSLLITLAEEHRVPAGGALAVDREAFSAAVTAALEAHPRIQILRQECGRLPLEEAEDEGCYLIVATGPLTSDSLAADIARLLGKEALAFFDAAAPIVEAASLDHSRLFSQSRYGKGEGADYLNAPMDKDTYETFIDALLQAERVIARNFEGKDLFKACQPVEEVARTGKDALRFGALKPVGLEDPITGERPYAVVQLRAENRQRSAYNLVGFQTNLTFPEQRRVFRMIPGLGQAEFLRYGVMHRNTFIDTPHLLNPTLAFPSHPHIRFAGQLTGTEGYCEAIASGLYVALCTFADFAGLPTPVLPRNSAFGSLVAYATDPSVEDYQPMHVNFGLVEPPEKRMKKGQRYAWYAQRARDEMTAFLTERVDLFEKGGEE